MKIRNKIKQKEYSDKHYRENKERKISMVMINNKRYNLRNREYIRNYLSHHSCVDCGNSDIRVLEFDHVTGDKFYDIGNMKRSSYSLKTLIAEIEKCEVRCANCHRIITHERRLVGCKGVEPLLAVLQTEYLPVSMNIP